MYIKKITRDHSSFSIYLSNNDSFNISESVFVRFNLYKGKEIFEEEIIKIKENNEDQKAVDYIMKKIRNRKTSYEVENILMKEGFNEKSIDYAIRYLKRYSFIDDEEYAKLFVRDKMNLNKYGPIKIEYLLKQKGLSKNTISQAMNEYNEERIYMNIKLLLNKRYKDLDLSDQKLKNKCIRYLLQRGFHFNDILNVLDWREK